MNSCANCLIPELRGLGGTLPLQSLPFGVTSAQVATICPEILSFMCHVMMKSTRKIDNMKLSSTAQPDSTSQMALGPWCEDIAGGLRFLRKKTCAKTAVL